MRGPELGADETARLQAQLQALVAGALRGLKGSAPSPSFTLPAPARAYGPYHEAAAVLSTFDRAGLQPAPPPPGETAPSGDIEALLADSAPLQGPSGDDRWALQTDVRRAVLRQLGGRERVEAVLSANAAGRPDDPTQAMFEAYLRGQAPPLEQQDARQVAGTFEVARWLRGLDFELAQPLPDQAAIGARSELLGLLQPFYDLAGAHFAGRQKQLQRLRDYVGVLPPGSVRERAGRFFERILNLREKPPIMIHGPGGSGKSALVARFIWEHTTLPDAERFPFAYLDFDRPGLLPEEPLTLLVEAVRQLGLQYPERREFCDRVRGEWQAQLAERVRLARAEVYPGEGIVISKQTVTVGGVVLPRRQWPESAVWERFLPDFASLLGNLKVEEDPFLLVLDTFEQVQYRGEVVVGSLGQFLAAFQRHVPRLRTVVAGRAPIGERPEFPTEPLELPDFDPAAAQGFLEAHGVAPSELAQTIADQVGGNPLSLKLAAEVWRKEGKSAAGVPDLVIYGVKENQIQGQLFRRIIEAVHDPKVQQLAHPGLVLRRVTPELIRQVLAGPCEVDVPDEAEAERLFEELKREVSLVRVEGDGLRHRPDVRRIMIDLLRDWDQEKAGRIETAAVAYYEQRDGPVERAEELYHRLSLQQPFEQIEPRWPQGALLDGARQHLYSALEELNIRERAWLASRLGRTLTPEEREQADLEGWERDTARRARELLQRGQVSAALAALEERAARRPGSPLYPLEAEARERQGDLAEARRVVEAGIAAAAEAGDRRQAIDLRLRGARIDLRLGDLSAAGRKLDEADGLATSRGDELVRRLEIGLVRLAARRAEAPGQDPAALEGLKAELRARFDRLADRQVAAQPALAAWLAVELGPDQPDALYRVARLTGLETEQQRLPRALGRALADWDTRVSREAGEPPGLLARKADLALPDEGTLNRRWTTFVLQAGPLALGELVARLPELVPDTPVPARLPVVLTDILRERAAAVATHDLVARPAAADGDQTTVSVSANASVSYGLPTSEPAGPRASGGRRLSGQQYRELHQALVSAFPTRGQVSELVGFRLSRNLDAIALTDDLWGTVDRLIQVAEAEGWTTELLVAARDSRPDNARLLTLARELGLTTARSSGRDLERTIRRAGSALDLAQWEARLGTLEAQVCRVEVGPSGYETHGTGFLLGPDLVMTTYHLVEDIISKPDLPPGVGLRFDYRQLPDGEVLHPGIVYRLAVGDWLIDASPPSPVDLAPDPGPGVPEPDQLDYALLRLDGEPGYEPIGGGISFEARAALRNWIALPSEPHDFAPDTPLFILQHPEDGSVELAGDAEELIGLNANGTRVRYRTRTKAGAAGSPCFDANLELIALHQRTYRGRRLGFLQQVIGQGTPISVILARLEQRGLRGLLGQAPA